MNLIIGSDLVPTDVNIDLFNKADITSLLGSDLEDIWNSADYRFFNLETPLSDIHSPINKQGPNLIAPTSTIKGIRELNPTLITLANNHILDHGVEGLNSTLELLKNSKIPTIGAGKNIQEALKPYIIEKNNIRIGIYTCAEHEFTIATEKSAGANPFDPLESLDHIKNLKSRCDYVIVLYHGGKEHYRYPSPNLQKVCRKIVEKGADLVVCQHSHCVGSFEEYEEATIVYGQGNFVFNKLDNEYWNSGLILKVNISNKLFVEYIPIKRNTRGIELAEGDNAQEILNGFYKRSKEILQDDFIENEYQSLVDKNILNYKRRLAGFGKWKSRIDRKIFNDMFVKRNYNKQQLLGIQNYIECEAHRELLLEGLKSEIRHGR